MPRTVIAHSGVTADLRSSDCKESAGGKISCFGICFSKGSGVSNTPVGDGLKHTSRYCRVYFYEGRGNLLRCTSLSYAAGIQVSA